jgi:RNA polymerase sigma factor (sigma-70 family)
MDGAGPGGLVRAAAGGDQAAWDMLVERFASLVWSVARAHRLSAADASDISQTTWLRLAEHIGRLRDPDRVAGWLATTARNECLKLLRQAGRQIATDLDDHDPPAQGTGADTKLLTAERDAALWKGFEAISARCQELLRLMLHDPPVSYQEISDTLDMPVGSIGPTRARCLGTLREQLAGAGITADTAGSEQ